MEKWHRALRDSVCSAEELAERFSLPAEGLRRVAEVFPFRIPRYYLDLIQTPGDGIFRQCIPDERELEDHGELLEDPLGEEKYMDVPNVIHHYPDRCVFLVSDRCAMYCRFCTRKRKFRTPLPVDLPHLDQGIAYIRDHAEIRDVLVSGGDPFLLEDERLEHILRGLRRIEHVETIRIGTRTPCVLPERITRKLTAMLKKYHPLFLNVHFNHPAEVTDSAVKALNRLADAGIPLGSQTVLLKGVNDEPEVLRELFRKLLKARVHPYYLFQCDLIYGTEHFRTPLRRGPELIRALRGWTTGMAIPHFAVDLPRGGGKVPLLPDYECGRDGDTLYFQNYRGERCEYPELPGEAEAFEKR